MLLVSLAVGITHVDFALTDGRHASQRIAQPFLPDAFAVGRDDVQFTAFGGESDLAILDDGRTRAVIADLVFPDFLPRRGIEGVKQVATEASSHKDPTVHNCGGGQWL